MISSSPKKCAPTDAHTAQPTHDILAPYAACSQALRAGRNIDAAEILNAQVRQNGESAGAWHLYGAMRLWAGEIENVKPYFLLALEESPDCREALQVLVDLEQRLGESDAAKAHKAKLCALIKASKDESEAEQLYTQAAALLSAPAHFNKAADLLKASLTLAPWRAKAWLGLALITYGRDAALCAEYATEALIRNPLLPEAWAMAVASLVASKNIGAAGRAVGRGVSLFPDNAAILGMISVLHEVGGAYDPGISRAWYTQPEGRLPLTVLKTLLDRNNENVKHLRKNSVLKAYGSISAHENSITAYMKAISLNLMPKDQAGYESERAASAQALQIFVGMKPQIATPAHIVGAPSQWMFQGTNDRDMRVTLAAALRKACPALTYNAPAPQKADKLRIAVIDMSSASHNATGMQGLVNQIDPEQFAVRRFFPVFAPAPTNLQNDDVRILPAALDEARACVAEFSPHIVLFSSLNIHPWLYQLVFSRLAPVQAALSPYPSTTGIDTIDYVISAEAFEPANADAQYSEKLIKLPGIGARLNRPAQTKPTLTRADLSLPEADPVFLCPQPIYKLLPVFTDIVAAILKASPKATFVMLDAIGAARTVMSDRLKACDPSFLERVKLLGRLNREEYMNFLQLSDVILDGFPASAGFALCPAMIAGTPIVAYRGEVAAARLTAGMLEQIGLPELITDTPEAYASLAIKLGSDAAYRQKISEKLRTASPRLFEDATGVKALEQFLSTAQPNPSH